MGTVMRIGLAVIALAASISAQSNEALFRGTAHAALKREFPHPDTSYILLDARSGEIVSAQWPDQKRAIPLGSLVKPFVALAYAAEHSQFPQHACHGTASRCWRPRGHGVLGLEEAVAHSCNAYFLALASAIRPAHMEHTARQFGLSAPSGAAPDTLIGLDGGWQNRPLDLAQAYVKLLAMRRDPVPQRILAGMTMAADVGTGTGLRVAEKPGRALIKTGTAKCTHRPKAPGDGFALAMWPAEAPRYVLLVRRHGEPGSHAAELAGKMIAVLQEGSRASAD